MNKQALLAGCFFAMTSVVLGAFGAHYLKGIFTPELLLSFETGVRYQFYHAMALLMVGLLSLHFHSNLRWVSNLFIAGIILFSGSIYALCMLKTSGIIGISGIGILTPLGGVCFIVAWALLLFKVAKYGAKQ